MRTLVVSFSGPPIRKRHVLIPPKKRDSGKIHMPELEVGLLESSMGAFSAGNLPSTNPVRG